MEVDFASPLGHLAVYAYDATDEASPRALAEVHTALLRLGVRPFEGAAPIAYKATWQRGPATHWGPAEWLRP